MKRIYKLMLFSILTLGMTACDFDTENFQQIPTDEAYKSVQDIQNGMNGAYYALGSYRFLGNYAVAYGDFCGGVSNGSSSTGHFYYQSNWIISDTDAELEDMWYYGLQVVDRTTRTIAGAKDVLAEAESLFLTEKDIADINLYMGQCYALKALANYYLVNLFGKPYHIGTDNMGLPLVKEEPIEPFTKIDRSNILQTYEQITSDITNAETCLNEATQVVSEPNAFYMGSMGLQALKARVYMSLGEYSIAEGAAKKAIELKGKGDGTGNDNIPSDEIYVSMWTSLAITDEDLFTIAKTEADNLSANSLNTLYGSYGATLTNSTIALYENNDIRKGLLNGTKTLKYQGLPTSAATSNIPIFRKSEMSLILAEIYTRQNNLPLAQNYLLYTAKRNKDITSIADLPTTQADLLQFISEERIREFSGEGHRFYDARRMGDKVALVGYEPFDIQQFVFPIPAAEINAGYMTQQNEGWDNNLPVSTAN